MLLPSVPSCGATTSLTLHNTLLSTECEERGRGHFQAKVSLLDRVHMQGDRQSVKGVMRSLVEVPLCGMFAW